MDTMTATEKRTWASETGTPLNGGKAMTPVQASFFIRIGDQTTPLDVSDDGWTITWHSNGRSVTYVSTPISATKAA